MKGQYLFYGFLPSVTAAVLTSQPALARIVSNVKLTSSPSVLTFTNSRTWLANNINTKLPNNKTQIFPDILPESGLTSLDLQLSNSQSNSVILTGNTDIPKETNVQQNERKFPSFSLSLTSGQNSEQDAFKTSSEQELKKTSVQPVSVQPAIFSLSGLQPLATSTKQPETQLSTILPTEFGGREAVQLLVVDGCSSICPPQNLIDSTTSEGNSTWELTGAPPDTGAFPPAETGQISPQPLGTQEFAPTNSEEIPDNLNPSTNPLELPTTPEEVRLESNQPITLAQALELAKRNNRDLQVSILELERSQAALRQAEAAFLPNVSLNADVTRSRSAEEQRQRNLNPISSQAESNTVFRGEAQLTYPLFTSGRRTANVKQAQEEVRLSELAVERQSEEIRLSVSTEYYDLQQADERVAIALSAVENARASLQDAQSLERAGVGTRFDVLQAQVNLANSQQELTNNLSQQQISRRRLATRLSVPSSVNLSAADPVELAGLWNQDLESSIILAFQNRPELQQLLAQRNINEQQRRAELAALGPQVNLVASYGVQDQFDDGTSITDGYSVGVRASLNLFDGGAARASAAQAESNVAIAETRFSEQRNQIRFQVEQAFSTQIANLENVQTANTALEQAREALRLARLRFKAGVGTQTDVINSENDLTRAEGNRITAILDYNRALAQLQRAVTTRALVE
ncbi:TolC family protein [Nodularia harveyana UHCC-0300]|uniref:TolC family protein n=1 Tax=Nodularia harveyana UHCC-0300 TaxID=2974287 RepID=A0ABU5UDG1_9CYAN|nr:TolC family protein [Nodularia harveyana]MEA5581570.1 TolC family protein [Nodularia harveyana UHCC-0300]